jgi:hypothetical protein
MLSITFLGAIYESSMLAESFTNHKKSIKTTQITFPDKKIMHE